MKRTIAFLLTLALCLGMFPLSAWAADHPFEDVPDNAYYSAPVLWAVANGITTGTTATTFSPKDSCTRAQAVTFLYRYAGSPEVRNTGVPFTDVPKTAYYYSAVAWAVENGITDGTGDGKFSPDQTCTRAQIVTFLWRSMGKQEVTSDNPFTDVKPAEYFFAPVLWAVENEITMGTAEGIFSPKEFCTRAQIVTFLWRANNVAGSDMKVLEQPENVEASAGEAVHFTFEVESDAAPVTYQWEYAWADRNDFEEIPASVADITDQSVLTVHVTQDLLNGQYVFRCTATDSAGCSLISNGVRVVEGMKMEVRYHPDPVRAQPGDTVNLSAEVMGGVPPYKVEWQSCSQGYYSSIHNVGTEYQDEVYPVSYDYDEMAGYTDCWITISDINSWETNEEIRCKFTDSTGAVVYTDAVMLYKGEPMSWYTSPESVFWTGQSTLRFEAEVMGGKHPYNLVWERYYNGSWEPIPIDGVNVKAQYDDGYGITLMDVVINENTAPWVFQGYYGGIRCVVYDRDGIRLESSRAYVMLDYVDPFVITQEPVDAYAGPNNRLAQFTVEVDGGIEPYSYDWFYQTGESNGATQSVLLRPGANIRFQNGGSTLQLNCATGYEPFVGKTLTCVVSDAKGDVLQTQQVTLQYVKNFSIVEQTGDVTALVGETVQLSVTAAGGRPGYTYNWYYRSTDESGTQWKNVDDLAGIYQSGAGMDTVTLKMWFDRPEYNFGYEYMCVVADADNKTIASEPVEILAGDLLHMTVNTDHIYTRAGNDVAFHVEVAGGKPPYQYQWYIMKDGTNRQWDKIKGAQHHSGENTDTLRVDVQQSFLEDHREYYCKVTDANGDTYSSYAAILTEAVHFVKQPGFQYSDPIVYTVEVAGGAAPYTYRWYTTSGIPVEEAEYADCIIGRTDGPTLTQDIHFAASPMWVYCVVTDANGDMVRSEVGKGKHPLLEEPEDGFLYESPANVLGNVGDVVHFTIKADEDKADDVNWFYEVGKEAPSLWWDYSAVYDGAEYQGIPLKNVTKTKIGKDTYEMTIQVEEWMLQEQAVFQAIAFVTYRASMGGHRYRDYNNEPRWSADARIISPEHPYVVMPLMNQTKEVGEYVNLYLSVGGGTAPYTFTWQGNADRNGDEKYEEDEWFNVKEITADGFDDSYMFRVTEESYGTIYRCIVTDAEGKYVKSYNADIYRPE